MASGWDLIPTTKGNPYRGVSGKADPALLEKAEARKGFVAVYVVGERDGDQVRIGLAQKPAEVFKTAQQWNWREIDVHAVLWTPSKKWAEDLKRATETELTPYIIRGSWYNLPPRMVVNTIVTCAQEIRASDFELFNDAQRYLKYEDEIAQAIKNRPQIQKQADGVPIAPVMPQPSAKVIRMVPRS